MVLYKTEAGQCVLSIFYVACSPVSFACIISFHLNSHPRSNSCEVANQNYSQETQYRARALDHEALLPPSPR